MNDNKQYFEGWYFKCTDINKDINFALIPGVSINSSEKTGFIQVIDKKIGSYYITYPYNKVHISQKPLSIQIGDNYFSKKGIRFNLNLEDYNLSGSLKFTNITDIRRTTIFPTIMGYYQYIKQLECYHDILSMKHNVTGSIKLSNKNNLNNEIIKINGKGYIEKDYGTSFPRKWIWIHSNTFLNTDTSLTLSIATVPIHHITIEGIICAILYNGKEYRFATYNGGKIINKIIDNKSIKIVMKKNSYKLIVNIYCSNKHTLIAPKLGVMNRKIKESVNSTGFVTLIKDDKVILNDICTNVCYEIQDRNLQT